jgi:hypothetical protein
MLNWYLAPKKTSVNGSFHEKNRCSAPRWHLMEFKVVQG